MATTTSASISADPSLPTRYFLSHDHSQGSAFTEENHHSEHNPTHAALISALACGGVIFIVLLCAMGWYWRKSLAKRCCSGRAKERAYSIPLSGGAKEVDGTPSTVASEWDVGGRGGGSVNGYSVPRPTASTSTSMPRSESWRWRRNELGRQPSNATTMAPYDPNHVGLGLRSSVDRERQRGQHAPLTSHPVARAAPTPPAPTRTSSAPSGSHNIRPSRTQGVTPQSVTRSYLDRSLPASPSISSMPVPITPMTPALSELEGSPAPGSTTTRDTGTSEQQQRFQGPAYTPSVYQPYPPTSLPHTRAQKASTAYNSHSTLASLPTRGATTHPPPSLPQPYSTVSLGSTAEIYRRMDSSSDLYRGLRAHSGRASASPQKGGAQETIEEEGPPWDFLSAEDAVGGGWRNSMGRKSVGGKSGWETVKEGDED